MCVCVCVCVCECKCVCVCVYEREKEWELEGRKKQDIDARDCRRSEAASWLLHCGGDSDELWLLAPAHVNHQRGAVLAASLWRHKHLQCGGKRGEERGERERVRLARYMFKMMLSLRTYRHIDTHAHTHAHTHTHRNRHRHRYTHTGTYTLSFPSSSACCCYVPEWFETCPMESQLWMEQTTAAKGLRCGAQTLGHSLVPWQSHYPDPHHLHQCHSNRCRCRCCRCCCCCC